MTGPCMAERWQMSAAECWAGAELNLRRAAQAEEEGHGASAELWRANAAHFTELAERYERWAATADAQDRAA